MQEELARVLPDGTYRLTPQSATRHSLDVVNEKATEGVVQAYNWWGAGNQQWVLSPIRDNKFRVGPRNVRW